jgi:hypothetical protein
MTHWHLERAVFLLGHDGPLTRGHESPERALDALVARVRDENAEDPLAQYPVFRLDPDEAALITRADVAGMYLCGVHPNLIRAFAGVWGIDYVASYRSAAL